MIMIRTGETVYEQILSLDANGTPITGATFDTAVYLNELLDTGTTVSVYLTDYYRGVYTAVWSANTIGSYQIYVKNNNTNAVFISNNIIVKSDDDLSTNIYIGL